jgi:Fic family protein
MIHYQFEAIHPFLDGNGRVGWLLIVLLLCEWGLLPQPLLNLSVYFEHYRQEYYDPLLSVSQQATGETWLRFFLRGVSEQAREGVFRIERLRDIRSKYQPIVLAERNPVRMAAVVGFVFSRPIFSIRQASVELGISYKTTRDYLEKLVQAGVIRETTGYARNRIFQSDDILKTVQGRDL